LCFVQDRKKPSFSKKILLLGLSLSWMDELYRYINWATTGNIKDDCPDRQPD